MSGVTPSPLTWTLRFKNRKTTVLLHVDPLQSFDGVKEELLRALIQRETSGKLHGEQTLPSSAKQIQLARPVDPNDPTKGWESLEDERPEEPVKKKQKKDDAATDSPKAAGIKDGWALAFRFTPKDGEDSWDVVLPTYDDLAAPEAEDDASA